MSIFFKNPAAIGGMILVSGDILLGMIAFYSGIYLRFGGITEGVPRFEFLGLTAFIFIMVLMLSSFFVELYNQDISMGRRETALRIMYTTCIAFFILSALYYLLPSIRLWRGILAYGILVFCLFQNVWHFSFRSLPRLSVFASRVLILGTGPAAEKIGGLVTASKHRHVLSGYIRWRSEVCCVPELSVVSNGNSILETVLQQRANQLVISLNERRGNLPLRDILNCKLSGIEVLDAPSFYEQMTGKLLVEEMKPSSLIFSDGFRVTSFKAFCKRVFDILLAVVGLILALPLFPVIALACKLDSPGTVIFKQTRVGKGEKNFALYKFRTMCCDAEKSTGAVWAEKDDCRVTRIGKFLRKNRLDELPQLYNVLKGDMSFIGPRPERPEFIERLKAIIPYYSERHFVKPGITGWAQVKYPYGASVEDALEKLRYDLYYVKHISFFLDILIVIETIKVVLSGRGGR